MHEDRSDRLRPGLAGAGVGGEHILPGLEASDRDGKPTGEEDFRACGEAGPAAGCCEPLGDGSALVPGVDCFWGKAISTPKRELSEAHSARINVTCGPHDTISVDNPRIHRTCPRNCFNKSYELELTPAFNCKAARGAQVWDL